MKRLFRKALIVGVAVLALGSCTAVLGFIFPNQFEIASASYDVAKMYALNYGQFGTTNHYLDIWLVSEGIIINSDGEGSGSGEEIGFFLISATPTLGEGTFTFDNDFYGDANTMYGGRAYIGASFSAGTSSARYDFAGGLLTVARTRIGDDYILDFEGTVEGGSTVVAHYRGPLEGAVMDVTAGGPVPNIR